MKKTKMLFTQAEWRLIVTSLNTLRNKLLAEGRYTDAVDDALLKMMTAPMRKIKIA
jgi:hypothetical protein